MNRILLTVLILYTIIIYLTTYRQDLSPPVTFSSDLIQTFTGTIISQPEPTGSDRYSFIFLTDQFINQKPTKLVVYFYANNQKKIIPGDIVSFTGKIKIPPVAKNPGTFNFRRYLTRQNIFYLVFVDPDSMITKIGQRRSWFLLRGAYYIRQSILARINKLIPNQEQAGVLTALLVGIKSNLTPDIEDIFKSAGVMHILVVSGAHVGFVVGIFYWILRYLLRLPKPTVRIILIPIIIVYTLITGACPSIVRSAIMAIFMLLAFNLNREPNLWQSLILSAGLILVFDYTSLYSVGFQLSFIATWGIVYLAIPTMKWVYTKYKLTRVLSYTLNIFIVSFAAQVAVAPVIAYYFYRISVIGIVSNVIIVPISALCLYLGFIGLTLYAVFGTLVYSISSFVLHTSVNLLVSVTNWFAQIPAATINIPQPKIWFLSWFYFTFLILPFIFAKLKIRRFLILVQTGYLIFFLSRWILSLTDNKLKITVLSVNQGDAILVDFPGISGNHKMLIDAGGDWQSKVNPGTKIVIPYLLSQGISRLNYVILTHLHFNHYLGLIPLLNEPTLTIDKFFVSRSFNQTIYDIKEIKHKIQNRKVKVGIFDSTYHLKLGKSNAYFYSPTDLTEEEDKNCIVTRIVNQNFSILLPADIPPQIQFQVAKKIDFIPSEILVAPNHGNVPMDETFLRKLAPKLIIISGTNPHPLLLRQIKKFQIPYYLTDRDGAVLISTDGKQVQILPYLTSSITQF